MREVKFEFSMSGLLIGLVLISMFASIFGMVASDFSENYDVTGNSSLANYDQINTINAEATKIQDKTKIEQDTGILDVIGGYFSSGYSALMITFSSFGMYDTMLEEATGDVNELGFFKPYLFTIMLLAILIGIILTVLVKTRL